MKAKTVKFYSAVLVFMSVLFGIYLVYYSAVIPGIYPEGDNVKTSISVSQKTNDTVEGSIVSADGITISKAEEAGVPAKCVSNAYGHLVGYRNINDKSGLRAKYEKELLTTTGKSNVGATLNLTIINSIQEAAFEAIKKTDGCVVVIENATGKILALTTASKTGLELDVNRIHQDWNKIKNVDGFLIPNWQVSLAPGSSIKPLIATLLYDKGYADEVYNDTGKEVISNKEFNNYGKASYGKVTMREALIHSVNTFFAHYASQVGRFELQNHLEKAGIGSTLDLDFASIKSSHNLGDCTAAEVAATGFGQGRLMMTPINIAMVGQAIANKGEMLKPSLVDSIVTSNGKNIYKSKVEKIGRICTEKAAKHVEECMKDTAESYKLDSSLNLRAKTGTAELLQNKTMINRAVFLSFNDKATVCIVENYTNRVGRNLEVELIKVYNSINNYYNNAE